MSENFTAEELKMLSNLIAEELHNGCYPPKARILLGLFDKINDMIYGECCGK